MVAVRRSHDQSVYSALHEDKEHQQHQMQLRLLAAELDEDQCTFHPEINTVSATLAEERRRQRAPCSVLDTVTGQLMALSAGGEGGGGADENDPANGAHAGGAGKAAIHTELHADAEMRRRRLSEYQAWSQEQFAFVPDIGVNKVGRSVDQWVV
jgi:hypothetical protein